MRGAGIEEEGKAMSREEMGSAVKRLGAGPTSRLVEEPLRMSTVTGHDR